MVEKTKKQECGLVVLGHSNTGKSTLCGQILLSLNQVDQREIDKHKQEAQKNGMESWWMAYVMDSDK